MTTAEGAIAFEALEVQAAKMMNLFVASGYERVAPAFIQPASAFLDCIGETIRARTYVFTDPNGEELCLRPDLTVPVCRLFLERGPGTLPAKYCYNGPAFRMQDGTPDPLRPREFRQAGVECVGTSSFDADRDVMAITLEAVQRAGLSSFTVRMGHIGGLSILLDALPMPSRWRDRLKRSFWRPKAFNAELKRLSASRSAPAFTGPEKLAAMDENAYLDYLDQASIPWIGERTMAEVLSRMRDLRDDAETPPLSASAVASLMEYLKMHGDAPQVMDQIAAFGHRQGCDLAPILTQLEAMTATVRGGSNRVHISTDFGRHFEYYTGLVFQFELDGAGVVGQVAGGGRYDYLIRALSRGAHDVPAVGAAIHTERLLLNVSRGVA